MLLHGKYIKLNLNQECYIVLQLYPNNVMINYNIVSVCRIPNHNRSQNTQYKVFDINHNSSTPISQHTGMNISVSDVNE